MKTPNMDKKYLTLNQLHKSGRIWWIRSLPTLKKWVTHDKDHNNLLKVVVVDDGKVPRYYFLPEHVESYVKAFTEGKIVQDETLQENPKKVTASKKKVRRESDG